MPDLPASEAPSLTIFNLDDVEKSLQQSAEKTKIQTENLVEAAKKKSEEILAQALEEKANVFSKAREEGHAAGYEEGLKKGQTQGEQDLIEAKQKIFESEGKDLETILKNLPEKISHEQQCLLEETRRDLLNLILDVASIAVAHEIKQPGETVCSLVNDLAQQVIKGRSLIVEVHSDQLASVEKFMPKIKEQFSSLEEIKLIARDDFEPCQIIVRNDTSELTATPQETLERLKNEWGL